MKLVRVFPRRTKATPTDTLAFVGPLDLFVVADRVHISVTFSWDLPAADRLEKEWRGIAPVEIGGPATGQRGGDFTPGLYLKQGYVITSRGCPNKCWFCSVWKREGTVRELPILEPARLRPWHVDEAGNKDETWAKFQRFWARPASVNLRFREFYRPLEKTRYNLTVKIRIPVQDFQRGLPYIGDRKHLNEFCVEAFKEKINRAAANDKAARERELRTNAALLMPALKALFDEGKFDFLRGKQ